MVTFAQLRRLAAECRADREKVMVCPDDLDMLLDIAEGRSPANGVEDPTPAGRESAATS